ncbi:MAG: DUF3299 domain-containing protein [Gammaproteobacteria bacterium]
MIKKLNFAAVTFIAGMAFNIAASAFEAQEITWDDLIPAEAEFDDPFTKLDDDTIYELTLVAMVYDQIEEGEEVDQETLANHDGRIQSLEEKGIDVKGLIAMRDEVTKEREAKLELTNNNLEGKMVRIPGYLLPLEFDDNNNVTEFFLVPYVGACIHTPPPPPNQIVHVTTEEGYTSSGGLFEAIWVDGIIRSERTNSNLSFVDGASDIPSGYMLDAINIELYE